MFDQNTIQSITDIAERNATDPAALLAIAEIESGGRPLYPIDGRKEPAIRFEGHYFDRRLTGTVRKRARDLGLASPEAGKVRNPTEQAARWQLLHRAMMIDRRAALESTSWGLGQIMGAHWQWLGFRSVDEMIADIRQSVAGQVMVMLRFIDKAGLTPLIAAHDWCSFARRYNGPSFQRNQYDLKLEAAWIGWKVRLSHASNARAIIAAVDKTPPRD